MLTTEMRRAYIKEMEGMPDTVIATAYAYAWGMCTFGVDVTKAWETATAQKAALDAAYTKGRYDEAERQNRWRQEHDTDKGTA